MQKNEFKCIAENEWVGLSFHLRDKSFYKKCTGVFLAADFKIGLTLMRGTNADA